MKILNELSSAYASSNHILSAFFDEVIKLKNCKETLVFHKTN